MKTIIKNILIKTGMLPAVLQVFSLIRQLASYPKWAALKKQDHIWLELGSGAKKGVNGWATIDLSGADIAYDLRKGIPLIDESVDRIYTSHMFEHIPYRELIEFINDCYRVLKKGASFPCVCQMRVCIFNLMLMVSDSCRLVKGMSLRWLTRDH